jgi:hypothetical protein
MAAHMVRANEMLGGGGGRSHGPGVTPPWEASGAGAWQTKEMRSG